MTKLMKMLILMFVLCVIWGNAFAADKTETLTFAWEHQSAEGNVPVTTWQMDWGVTAGGPYAKLSDIPYQDAVGGTYESPVQAVVTGQPGTNETRYFILRACGDVPQEDGSILYECSEPSNEVSYSFWIESTGFSVPMQFRIMAQ